MYLDLYVHWVSRSMHLTELKQSDWVISALIINEFEKFESRMERAVPVPAHSFATPYTNPSDVFQFFLYLVVGASRIK